LKFHRKVCCRGITKKLNELSEKKCAKNRKVKQNYFFFPSNSQCLKKKAFKTKEKETMNNISPPPNKKNKFGKISILG